MSDRGLMFPIIGALTTTIIVMLYRFATGSFPNLVVLASLYLIGIGIGLIRARLDRLGPFNGHLGTPWFESDLHATLSREVSRALRFRRQLTVAAVRSGAGIDVDWSDHLRLADQAFNCRNGWSILILAETPPVGALKMMERVETALGSELHAALLIPDPTLSAGLQIERDLMGLLSDPSISPNAGLRGLRQRYELAGS